MPDGEPDGALLVRWAAGDREAGETLLRRHFDWLHGFFYTKVAAASEDLVQQTMLACVEQVERLPQVASFKAYVLGIARFKLYGHLRQRSAKGFDPIHTSMEDALGGASGGYSQQLQERTLQEAMHRLPADVQLVLELRYWEDLTSREIADVLNVPASTVRSRIHRARRLLAEELAEGDSEVSPEAALGFLVKPDSTP